MESEPSLLTRVDDYIEALFVPPIQVSPCQGKLLYLLVKIARGAPGVDVDVRTGPAADLLQAMIAAGEPDFDVVFIDADKPGYLTYLELALRLARVGTLILADNVIRNGLVMDEAPPDANAVAARAFNAAVAAHPRLESLVLPVVRHYVDGMAISIVSA